MKLSQLSSTASVVDPSIVDKRRSARRLGPRRITAIDPTRPDGGYALAELLAAIRALTQDDDPEQQAFIHHSASILAAELARLGTQAANLLKPETPHLDTKV